MAVKRRPRTLPDTYFALVKELPLTHLRGDTDLDAAEAMINRLLQEDLDEGQQAYLDVLTDLVESYEDKEVQIRDASEGDVLRVLMQSHGLSQSRLAKRVGIAQSTLSAVLTGNRSLTKEQVIALGRFFHVSPAAFLPS